MARTRSTRRRLSGARYAELQRSSAEIAAQVPPTRSQFDLALDDGDFETIFDYLRLNPEAFAALDATNNRLANARANGNDDDTFIAPSLWCMPVSTSRGMRPITVFEEIARNGWMEMIEWFFFEPDHRIRWRTLLMETLAGMLLNAASCGQSLLVEILLRSSVFLEELEPDAQQEALKTAQAHASNRTIHDILVAHGFIETHCVEVDFPSETTDNGRRDHDLNASLRVTYDNSLQLFHDYPVADASRLFRAIYDGHQNQVRVMITERFVDIDASSDQGMSPLIMCVQRCRYYPDFSRLHFVVMMRWLLEYNANTTIVDLHGRTALHYAIEYRVQEMVDLLLDHITKVYGAEAIHNDRMALKIAHSQRGIHSLEASYIVASLLKHGACDKTYNQLMGLVSANESTPCEGCNRSGKRKREDEA